MGLQRRLLDWRFGRGKNDFDEAAMLPFNEEDDLNKTTQEPRHG